MMGFVFVREFIFTLAKPRPLAHFEGGFFEEKTTLYEANKGTRTLLHFRFNCLQRLQRM
jgi:hypothetical protein